MDTEVFMLSEMTVEVHGPGDRRVFGFNGTTEWALDSVEERDAVWLPREGQLRELLAGTFRALRRADGQWQVDDRGERCRLPASSIRTPRRPTARRCSSWSPAHLIRSLCLG